MFPMSNCSWVDVCLDFFHFFDAVGLAYMYKPVSVTARVSLLGYSAQMGVIPERKAAEITSNHCSCVAAEV